MYPILFFIFAGIAVAGAISLLAQKAPIYSALSLVSVMGALAVIYLLLGAEFIAFIQIIVYAGAIMVLFVFVIMLLNAEAAEKSQRSRVARLLGFPIVVLLIVELAGLFGAQFGQTPIGSGDYLVQVAAIGDALFHRFLLPFEVTSVLFLVGVMGAVVLAARREEPAPRPAAVPRIYPAETPTPVGAHAAETTPAHKEAGA